MAAYVRMQSSHDSMDNKEDSGDEKDIETT